MSPFIIYNYSYKVLIQYSKKLHVAAVGQQKAATLWKKTRGKTKKPTHLLLHQQSAQHHRRQKLA
jgi:hypothetical protein